MIRLRFYKKDSKIFNLRPQWSLFPECSLYHFVSSVTMIDSLPLYCYQVDCTPFLYKQKAYPIPPFKQPSFLPLLCNQEESPLLRALLPSLDSPYKNQPFPHWYWNIFRSTCPEAGFTSDTNDFMPDSNNPFRHTGLVLINLLGGCEINPESHLPWEVKDKRVVECVKCWLTS